MGWFTAKRAKPLVLHIDDSTTILLTTRALLGRLGLDARSAASAAEGLRIAEKEKPDLILLDTQMPGMDGHEACAALKRNPKTKAIPVLMLTGVDGMKDVQRALDAGADGYILKPVEEARLKAKLAEKIALP